ncbi:hypothetical protein I3900191A7_15780 [Clostridium baratii]
MVQIGIPITPIIVTIEFENNISIKSVYDITNIPIVNNLIISKNNIK